MRISVPALDTASLNLTLALVMALAQDQEIIRCTLADCVLHIIALSEAITSCFHFANHYNA